MVAIRAAAQTPGIGWGGRRETTRQAELRGRVDVALLLVMQDGLLHRPEAAALTWDCILADGHGGGRAVVQCRAPGGRRTRAGPEGHPATALPSRRPGLPARRVPDLQPGAAGRTGRRVGGPLLRGEPPKEEAAGPPGCRGRSDLSPPGHQAHQHRELGPAYQLTQAAALLVVSHVWNRRDRGGGV